jgi:hypothetical protein
VKTPKYDEAGSACGFDELVVESYAAAEALLREINPLTRRPSGGSIRRQTPK